MIHVTDRNGSGEGSMRFLKRSDVRLLYYVIYFGNILTRSVVSLREYITGE